MNFGILIICTGNYTVFFKDLYESSEKFFLKSHNKTYYVFTDGDIPSQENIVKIHQENLGWPNNTMKRFEIFNKHRNSLMKEEFLFCLNANMKFLDEVNEEVLPEEKNSYLMRVNHHGFSTQPINFEKIRKQSFTLFDIRTWKSWLWKKIKQEDLKDFNVYCTKDIIATQKEGYSDI